MAAGTHSLVDAGRSVGHLFSRDEPFDLHDPEVLEIFAAFGAGITLAAMHWVSGRKKWEAAIVGAALAIGVIDAMVIGRRVPLSQYLREHPSDLSDLHVPTER